MREDLGDRGWFIYLECSLISIYPTKVTMLLTIYILQFTQSHRGSTTLYIIKIEGESS